MSTPDTHQRLAGNGSGMNIKDAASSTGVFRVKRTRGGKQRQQHLDEDEIKEKEEREGKRERERDAGPATPHAPHAMLRGAALYITHSPNIALEISPSFFNINKHS